MKEKSLYRFYDGKRFLVGEINYNIEKNGEIVLHKYFARDMWREDLIEVKLEELTINEHLELINLIKNEEL